MNKMEVSTIGERIKTLRKKRGYNQKDLANLLGKSLRTIQKYESGEIEVSIAMVNELAKVLDTTSTYLLGHQTGDFKFDCLSDVMECLFQLEKISGLHFSFFSAKLIPALKPLICKSFLFLRFSYLFDMI